MAYTVEFKPAAAREFRKLPRDMQLRVATAIGRLSDEPRPPGVRKLAGSDDVYRVRVGDYRIIYSVRDKLLLVIVMRVRHRSNAYE
jgi:mRNA interferase RelE/StbE